MEFNIDDIKTGDSIYLKSSNRLKNVTVTKVTKTLIICDNIRILKRTGASAYSGSFFSEMWEIISDKKAKEIIADIRLEKEKLRREILGVLMDSERVGLIKLREISNILKR